MARLHQLSRGSRSLTLPMSLLILQAVLCHVTSETSETTSGEDPTATTTIAVSSSLATAAAITTQPATAAATTAPVTTHPATAANITAPVTSQPTTAAATTAAQTTVMATPNACATQTCSSHGTCLPAMLSPYYVCSCMTGYSGQTCSTVSPCVTNGNQQCLNRGTCTPTSISPNFYTCTCYSGYTGQNCTTVVLTGLYPYGKTANDLIAVLNSDDGSSVRIGFNQGFLFYGRFLTSVFINMNGFMSFDINYMSSTPLPFPHLDGLLVDLLSPFWADADSTGMLYDCCGVDVVYYKIYQINPARTTPLSPTEQLVFDLATSEGQAYLSTNFIANWVMVVTWSNLIPYPYNYNQFSFERNTFQVIMAMDSANTRSFVSYRYGPNSWNQARPAVMGLQALLSNYYFYDLIRNGGNPYQLPTVSAPGLPTLKQPVPPGIVVFNSTGTVQPSAKIQCLQWVGAQSNTASYLLSQVNTLPACPCSAIQALFAPGYTWLPGTNCFVTTFTFTYYYLWPYGYYSYPNPYANKCCYDLNAYQYSYYWYQWQWMWTYVWLGDLITVPGYQSGSSYMYNPLYYGDYAKEDQAKRDCCLYSNNCQLYNSVRPLDTCARFTPPSFAYFYGDPHISTLDGFQYDYNGVGEYWMMMADVIFVQTRTAVAWDTNGQPVAATVFSAFAFKVPKRVNNGEVLQNETARVFLAMDDTRLNLNMLIMPIGVDNAGAINMTQWLYNQTMQLQDNDTLTNYNGLVLNRLSAGQGLSIRLLSGIVLVMRLSQGQMSMTVSANFGQLGQTGGLLGVFNNNAYDDLKLRDGRVLPSNSSTEIIYSQFGESWRIEASESLMWYPPNATPSSFQNTSFIPIFEPTFSTPELAAQADVLCGGVTTCLLDYAATGNSAVANATAAVFNASSRTAGLLSRSSPTINGSSTIKVTVGTQFSTTYVGTDQDGNRITLNMTGMPQGATFDINTGVFIWTPTDLTAVPNLRIDGVDISGVSAVPLMIVVLACDCSGHGVCQFDSIVLTYNDSYRYQIAACSCYTNSSYSGDRCNDYMDSCQNYPCGVNATCQSVAGGGVNAYNLSYNCIACPAPEVLKSGKCQQPKVVQFNLDNSVSLCTNTTLCQNGGQCQGNNTYYSCTCPSGFTGKQCESSFTACSSSPCLFHGTCVSNNTSFYTCICAAGFTGVNCQTAIDECISNPCKNNAGCTTINMMSVCLCAPGYTGTVCDSFVDSCQSSPCKQNGTCVKSSNSFSCTCPPLFTGPLCETSLNVELQTLVRSRVGGFTWDKTLTDLNSMLSTSYQTKLCAQMTNYFSGGLSTAVYKSCRVVAFRQGSVYALTLLTFSAPPTFPLDNAAFSNLVYSTLLTSLSLSNNNPNNINPNQLQVSVVTSTSDPCVDSKCQDTCDATSASSYNCSCFTGRVLTADGIHCRPSVLPPSDVDSRTLAIALPLGVVGGVGVIIVALYYFYYFYMHGNFYSEEDEDEEEEERDRVRGGERVSDRRSYPRGQSNRRHDFPHDERDRRSRDRFGFSGSEYDDWQRGQDHRGRSDNIPRPHRLQPFAVYRLPSRGQGGASRSPSGEGADFRMARAYQPYSRSEQGYRPFLRYSDHLNDQHRQPSSADREFPQSRESRDRQSREADNSIRRRYL